MSETIKMWSQNDADYIFYADRTKKKREKKQDDIIPPELDSL